MHDLSFEHFIKAENPWSYLLEAIWVKRQSWAIPVLIVGTIIFGVALGWQATEVTPETIMIIVAGLAIFLALFSKPELVILSMLILSTTTIDYELLPRKARVTPIELCVIILLGLIVARIISNREKYSFVRTALDWPVFLFILATTISLLNAKYFLGTYAEVTAFPIWRQLFGYMGFFAVTNLIRSRRQLLTLVGGLFVMATIVAGFMIAQEVVGTGTRIIPGQQSIMTASVLGQEYVASVARLALLPGALLVFMMFFPTLILHVTPGYLKPRKWLTWIPVVFLPLAIAFTFDRNMWISIAVGASLFILIARLRSQRLVLLILILAIGAIGSISLFNVYFPRIDTVVETISARFNTILTPDELLEDSSTQWRLIENEYAIPKFLENPILGIGPGSEYRRPLDQRGPEDSITHFIHNAYLWLLVDVGLVGFLPFLWFSVAFLLRGVYFYYRLEDPILRSIVIGLTISYVALMISSVATPRFIYPNGPPLIGVMLGINEVAIKLRQQSTLLTISK